MEHVAEMGSLDRLTSQAAFMIYAGAPGICSCRKHRCITQGWLEEGTLTASPVYDTMNIPSSCFRDVITSCFPSFGYCQLHFAVLVPCFV